MSWLSKDIQIGMFTMLDMQSQAYQYFLDKYKTQALALKHTKIYMDSIALLGAAQNGGRQ